MPRKWWTVHMTLTQLCSYYVDLSESTYIRLMYLELSTVSFAITATLSTESDVDRTHTSPVAGWLGQHNGPSPTENSPVMSGWIMKWNKMAIQSDCQATFIQQHLLVCDWLKIEFDGLLRWTNEHFVVLHLWWLVCCLDTNRFDRSDLLFPLIEWAKH